VNFAAVTLYFASQRVFIVVVYFVVDLVRKRLDTLSYLPVTQYRTFPSLKQVLCTEPDDSFGTRWETGPSTLTY
jgi:hypothetical protein